MGSSSRLVLRVAFPPLQKFPWQQVNIPPKAVFTWALAAPEQTEPEAQPFMLTFVLPKVTKRTDAVLVREPGVWCGVHQAVTLSADAVVLIPSALQSSIACCSVAGVALETIRCAALRCCHRHTQHVCLLPRPVLKVFSVPMSLISKLLIYFSCLSCNVFRLIRVNLV